jgi:hypothetical protein
MIAALVSLAGGKKIRADDAKEVLETGDVSRKHRAARIGHCFNSPTRKVKPASEQLFVHFVEPSNADFNQESHVRAAFD